jgi:ABC-type transport system involved in cytochrome bd biosynthesis fused ATPase/permease subunit
MIMMDVIMMIVTVMFLMLDAGFSCLMVMSVAAVRMIVAMVVMAEAGHTDQVDRQSKRTYNQQFGKSFRFAPIC